jgi:3-deoxy-manno-octulosonate cytidylyltransferase (CMP-KDO synthetase)
MKASAIIPARLGSTRLPRKVLADIHGKPLVWHVWNQVCRAHNFDSVYVATDSTEVQEIIESFGGQVLMTSPDCRSGTERIVECIDRVESDFIVNVQGDEPLIDPGMLDALVARWLENPVDLITPVFRINTTEEINNPNVVKVVRRANREAIYFSRSPIPFVRDTPQEQWLEKHDFWGHIGVYGYHRKVLADYPNMPVSPLEQAESLEQLRFLDAGYTFQTLETDYRSVAVDVLDDLERVRELLK